MNSIRKYIEKREIEVYYKENKLNLAVFMLEQKAYVHIRKFAEQLGFKVLWNEKKRRIIIYK